MQWLIQLPVAEAKGVPAEQAMGRVLTETGQEGGHLSKIAPFHDMQPHPLGHRFTERAEARFAEMSLTEGEQIKRSDAVGKAGEVGESGDGIRGGRQKVMLRPTPEQVRIDR